MGQPGMPGSQFPGEDAQIRRLKDLERSVQQFAAANVLATAGISAAEGGVLVNGFMEFKREDDTRGVRVDPVTGTFTAYDSTGDNEVARFGALLETDPGEYGVEVLVGSTWVRLGDQTTTWASFAKPSTYNAGNEKWTPDTHTHVGGDITSQVASAAQSDGSQYGWTNTVAGTEFYALWVGNDGGYHFGRNTSSIKYKENVRDVNLDGRALALRPVIYDRKPTYKYPEDEDGNRLIGPEQKLEGAKNELGLIAEEVAEVLPEIVTRYGGEIDGVRYDLLGVAMIPVVQRQAAQIRALTIAVRELGGNV